MSFTYPIPLFYNQQETKACVACALTSYFNVWRWATLRAHDDKQPPKTFSAAYLYYCCQHFFPSSHGYTYPQMIEVLQRFGMMSSSLYTFDDFPNVPPRTKDILMVFIPEMEEFSQEKQEMIRSVVFCAGFVFGLTDRATRHALYACGYDEIKGIQVVDSTSVSEQTYFLSWDIMCDPNHTQQFFRFLSPFPLDFHV